jgi:uncharacterized protein
VIAYLDTSAIVPLLIEEPGSALCRHVWDAADAVVCSELGYVEAAAALAQALRLERIRGNERAAALRVLDLAWSRIDVVPVHGSLLREAAALAGTFPLRGYDAVHCAAALRITAPELTAVSGDQQLLAAWRERGIAVIDTAV